MKTKDKQFGISLLLILSIFLGICLGSADRDLFYIQKNMPKTAQQEFSQNKTCSYNAADGISDSAQMLEARSVIELINDTIRHSANKNSRFLFRLLLLAALVVLFRNSDFDMAIERTQIPILRKKAIVLNYIHNKDGKK